jgi:hypothetical protein
MAERRVQRDHRRSFGETVAFPNGDAGRSEPAGGVNAEGRATGDEVLDSSPESLANFGIDELIAELPHKRVGLAAVINCVGEARPLTNGPAEQLLLNWRLCRFLLDGLADLLINARNADDDRGPDFSHSLRQLVELAAIGHLRAVVVHDVIEGARGDVRKRQERDADVSRIEAEIDSREVLVGGDVAVGEGNAFRLACGSGGVDEGGQIAGLNGTNKRVEHRVALCAACVCIGEQLAHGDGSVRGGRVHYYDGLKRSLRAYRLKLVELLASGDEGDAAIGVANLLGDLLASQSGIKRHVCRANGQHSEVGDCPLPAILADEGDAVALLRAEAQQCRSQRTNSLIHLLRGDRVPLAEFVLPQDGTRISRRGDANEDVVDRGDLRRSHCVACGSEVIGIPETWRV